MLFSSVWWMGKAKEISFPFHNSFPIRNNFPKELFNHKLQLVTHWKGEKKTKSVMKNQPLSPSRELKETALFYYYLAHPGVWLISTFMAYQDVLVSLLRTVRSVFLLFSGLTLHFLEASSTLLNAGGAWSSLRALKGHWAKRNSYSELFFPTRNHLKIFLKAEV